MFYLEESISDWRRQMLAAGIKTPAPLEELEIHLREDIARQMQSGLSAPKAYETAANKVGHAPELNMEFKKVSAPMDMQKIIKLAGAICVAIALLCQVSFCSPPVFDFAFAHGLRFGLMTRMLALAVLVIPVAITVLSWKFNHKLLPFIHNQWIRRAVGIVCYGGCLLWIRFVLFHLPASATGTTTGSFFLIYSLFGSQWTVMAILGGVGHGLEQVAVKKSAAIDLSASQS